MCLDLRALIAAFERGACKGMHAEVDQRSPATALPAACCLQVCRSACMCGADSAIRETAATALQSCWALLQAALRSHSVGSQHVDHILQAVRQRIPAHVACSGHWPPLPSPTRSGTCLGTNCWAERLVCRQPA